MKILLSLALALVLTPAAAEDVGRYQAISLSQGGRSGDRGALTAKVLIVDTRDGHLWVWSENELLVQKDQDVRRYGNALIYQGRVKPGKHMGEIVEQAPN